MPFLIMLAIAGWFVYSSHGKNESDSEYTGTQFSPSEYPGTQFLKKQDAYIHAPAMTLPACNEKG